MIIYLDQNKWIDLARVMVGNPKGDKFREVYRKIEEKVKSGAWKFPLSIIHYMEVFATRDPNQRRDLISIMSTFGSKYYIRPYPKVQLMELQNSLARRKEKKILTVDEYVFSSKITDLLGAEQKDLMMSENSLSSKLLPKNYLTTFLNGQKDPFAYLLSSGYNVEDITNLGNIWARSPEELEIEKNELKDLKESDRMNFLLKKAFEFEIIGKLNEICEFLELPISVIAEYLQEKEILLEVLRELSVTTVQNKLRLRHYKNSSKKLDRNDIKDFAFLSVAIPYTDAIISEKTLVSYIQQEKLDSEFNALVSSDLNFLLTI